MSNPNEEEQSLTAFDASSDAVWRSEIIRQALPDCQPQEGSPANTFTDAEKERLQPYIPNMQVHHHHHHDTKEGSAAPRTTHMDILQPWSPPADHKDVTTAAAPPRRVTETPPVLDWHGAPRFATPNLHVPRQFRQQVREGRFVGPTNGVCPGFLQCNLVVLPPGKHAFDFLLFCQRNPKACPLIEVCEAGSYVPVGVAPDADLRTDCPKYAIYRKGVLEQEVHDVTEYWPENAVAFLIGCSFSYDGALMEAGIPLRSAQAGKNVPMYKTSLKCRPAGSLSGNMVVSMKPIPALQVANHVEITARYPHAHGGPLCIGCPDAIGIDTLDAPDWGEAIPVRPDEVPVFHACGVTPQAILMESKVPFAITHSAGHMFVTDLPSDMNV